MALLAFGSPTELIVIAVIVLILFGNRLPSVMRSLGRGVTEFKKGIEGIEDDDEHDRRREQKSLPRNEAPPTIDPASSTPTSTSRPVENNK